MKDDKSALSLRDDHKQFSALTEKLKELDSKIICREKTLTISTKHLIKMRRNFCEKQKFHYMNQYIDLRKHSIFFGSMQKECKKRYN